MSNDSLPFAFISIENATRRMESTFELINPQALMVYDWFICLSREADLVWKKKIQLSAVLYFILRYLTIIHVLGIILLHDITLGMCGHGFFSDFDHADICYKQSKGVRVRTSRAYFNSNHCTSIILIFTVFYARKSYRVDSNQVWGGGFVGYLVRQGLLYFFVVFVFELLDFISSMAPSPSFLSG
ncbi:hypothetical protein BU17DRAFT_67133 [Hysterangium stoloniferum]|nr:hypothetical protein BU17DRAFT_67133 [Hysterangium stoloniferum]